LTAGLVSGALRSMKCCAAEPGSIGQIVKYWTPDLRRSADALRLVRGTAAQGARRVSA